MGAANHLVFLELDDPQDFFDGGDALFDLFHRLLEQQGRAGGHGGLAQLRFGRLAVDEFSQGGRHAQQLKNAGAPQVAGFGASLAAPSVEEREIGLLTVQALQQFMRGLVFLPAPPANLPKQALGHDQVYRGADQVRVHAQVQQPRHGSGGAVGVKGGKQQVAGHGSVEGDVGRFEVANFTDQEHVGVLAQDRAQAGGKCEPSLVVHLYLGNACQLDFNRIFHGDDVDGGILFLVDERVERGGLAAAGRTRDQNHALRLIHGCFQ